MTFVLRPSRVDDVICPTCGFYCSGKGGVGCIDKGSLIPTNPMKCITCLEIQKSHPNLTARELSRNGSYEAATMKNGNALCETHAFLDD